MATKKRPPGVFFGYPPKKLPISYTRDRKETGMPLRSLLKDFFDDVGRCFSFKVTTLMYSGIKGGHETKEPATQVELLLPSGVVNTWTTSTVIPPGSRALADPMVPGQVHLR